MSGAHSKNPPSDSELVPVVEGAIVNISRLKDEGNVRSDWNKKIKCFLRSALCSFENKSQKI